ncbi:MAG: alpha/beta fold hydrolase [Saprospiraceae bacterium]
MNNQTITIETLVSVPVSKAWNLWTDPNHIVKWSSASPEWHTPRAEHDLKPGGTFNYRMEAKNGSMGFDFGGVFDVVTPNEYLEYTIGDNRKVKIWFSERGDQTYISETFEAESTNPIEMQRAGWQAIMDSFKTYAEKPEGLEQIHFEIEINAKPEKVYETMLDEQHYKEWTSIFNPTSRYEGSWKKDSKMLFIGTNEKGENEGMVSRIKENIPNQYVSIEHLGMVSKGQEITTGDQVTGWAGSLENYTFLAKDEKTLLHVDMDTNQEFKSYFQDTWPKALDKLKSICESLVLIIFINLFSMQLTAQGLKSTGYAPVNGQKLYYEIQGEGSPIILLHGAFMTIHLNWAQIIPELSKTRKVIALEMQGHGHTADINRDISFPALADDVAAVMKYLKIDHADILGYSFGGTIAYQFAIQYPDLVNKLIIISSTYKSEGWQSEVRNAFQSMKPEYLDNTPLNADYISVAPDTSHWHAFLNKMLVLIKKHFDLGDEKIKSIKAPVLLIMGDNDGIDKSVLVQTYQLLGGCTVADMTGVPKSRLAIIPGQSHVSVMMETGVILSTVHSFLN